MPLKMQKSPCACTIACKKNCKQYRLVTVLDDIEMPLIVLARIERYGALVDAHLLGQQSLEIAEKLTELERQTLPLPVKSLT